jgi:hypothetical protein
VNPKRRSALAFHKTIRFRRSVTNTESGDFERAANSGRTAAGTGSGEPKNTTSFLRDAARLTPSVRRNERFSRSA